MFDYERIKLVRKSLGFKSREDFAKKINIPFATLRSYEQGKIENIPHSFLLILVENFDVNINWLMTGQGKMFNSKQSDIQKVENNTGNNSLNNYGVQSNNHNTAEQDKDIQDILKKAASCINQNNKESFIKHVKSWIVDNL